MSTRCQIQVEGSNVIIYKHMDGMPDRVLPWLEPFVARFHAARGHEPDYLTARILVDGVREDGPRREPFEFIGWGLDTEYHGDIAYLYRIRRDGTVEVMERGTRNFLACTGQSQ